MHTVRELFGVASLGLLAACAPTRAPASTDADVTAIKALNEKWAAAQTAGNVEGILAPLAADFVLMPPNESAQTGIPAARAWVEKLLAQVTFTSGTAALDEVIVSGDWAFARGTFSATSQPKSGGSPTTSATKYALLLRRQADGSWKIARDIWNAAPPLAAR